MTPPIPFDIQDIRADEFMNVFEYLAAGKNPFPNANHPNLWGTETLAGDWDGRMLIVMKDFAPTEDIENRKDGRAIYSHRPDFPTNANLVKLLASGGVHIDLYGKSNLNCGVVMASASFLLRKGKLRSGKNIPAEILKKSWPALEFTVKNMPNLTDIVLCGVEAFTTFQRNGKLNGDRKQIQSSRSPANWQGYRVHCTTHTQPIAINRRKMLNAPSLKGWDIAEADWEVICRHAWRD